MLFADVVSMNDILCLLRQYGPMLLIVIFFLWQGWVRECRMSARIDILEDQQRDVLLPLVEKSTVVITANTAMMERLQHVLDSRWAEAKDCLSTTCKYRVPLEGR